MAAVALVMAAAPAVAAVTVPAGTTVTVSGATLSACNALTYGYQLDGGTNVPVASKPFGCTTLSAPGVTIGPFPTTHTLRLFLNDQTCNVTYFSDGNHGIESGTNPVSVAINDGGPSCSAPGPRPPTPGNGNFVATVTRSGPPACTSGQTGDIRGPLTVTSGQHLCISNARVVGPITVQPGGSLTVLNSKVAGGITADGATFVELCGTDVSRPGVSITNSTGTVIVGDPASGCAADRVAGNLTLTGNTAGLVIGGTTTSVNTTVNNNSGSEILIEGTTSYGSLGCSGNAPAPSNGGQPNTAPTKTGQCASL